MAKKIILFLSLLSEDESKRKTQDYACATGVLGMDEAHKITGTQTNERRSRPCCWHIRMSGRSSVS